MSLTDHERLDLHALCDALIDGTISAAEQARLEQWLATSIEARRLYVRTMTLSASLMEYAGEMQAEAPDVRREPARVVRPAAWIWTLGSLAAAAVLVLVFWLGRTESREPTLATEEHDNIARLSGAKDARWAHPALHAGDELHAGQRLELAGGFAEIIFDSGALVTLEGPASLDVNSAWEAVLHRGTLKASVPPEAVGFRVSNPSVAVVDLGTEFSMVADESGDTEVFVLRGAVEAAGPEQPPVVLREKQAQRFARAGRSEVRDREAKLARFARKVTFERFTRPAQYVHWSFDEKDGDLAAASVPGFDAHFEPATPQTHTAGIHGSALRFDGGTSARVAFPGIRQRAPRTVAFWVQVPDDAPLTEAATIIAGPLGGTGRSVAISWNRDRTQGPLGALRIDAGRGSRLGSTGLRDGRWHHVAVVFSPKGKGDKEDGGLQVRQYVDGRLEAGSGKHLGKRVRGAEKSAVRTAEVLWIGGEADAPGAEKFRGLFDELFVADTALTPQEIRHLMRENAPATPEILAAQ